MEIIRAGMSGENIAYYDRQIWERDRWSTFPKYHESCEFCVNIMRENGLADAKLVETPADGETKYGDWVNPIAWDIKEATLEVLEPKVEGDQRILANWTDVPNSIVMWCAPTPSEGLEAEVVDISGLSDHELADIPLKGKMLFGRTLMKMLAARKEAAGVILDTSMREDIPAEATRWVNAWGDKPGTWMMNKHDSKLVGFSLSPAKSRFLRRLLQKGTVKVKAKVDSRFYIGTLPYATAVLKGTGDEEVLVSGHLYEQGAHDNASGAAIILEALRALNRLVEQGRLPRPRRSIRVLQMAECYGTLAYLERNRDRIPRMVAHLTVDTGAGKYEHIGSCMNIIMSPHCATSYVDALLNEIAETYYQKFAPRGLPMAPAGKKIILRKYSYGTDNYFYDPTIGVPSPLVALGMGGPYYHNSADTPETVDPRSCRDLATVDAVFLYFIANAGYKETLWLAQLAFSHGFRNIIRTSQELLAKALSSMNEDELTKQLYDGIDKIPYCAELETKRLRSVQRLVSSEEKQKLLDYLHPLEERLRQLAKSEAQCYETAIQEYAAATGAQIGKKLPKTETRWDREAFKVVPKRKLIGPLALDDLPYDKWKIVKRSPRWWGPETAALWWADGRRSVKEVRELVDREFSDVTLDLLAYFKFLEENGYVDFV